MTCFYWFVTLLYFIFEAINANWCLIFIYVFFLIFTKNILIPNKKKCTSINKKTTALTAHIYLKNFLAV